MREVAYYFATDNDGADYHVLITDEAREAVLDQTEAELREDGEFEGRDREFIEVSLACAPFFRDRDSLPGLWCFESMADMQRVMREEGLVIKEELGTLLMY